MNPCSPLPQLCDDMLSWKKWPFFGPFLDLLQISCSVCGPGLFLCSEAWIPDLAMSCSSVQQRHGSEAQAAHHWMLLLSSVPFASDIFIFPMECPTWFTPSLRGGMRSLMRSRPFASSKLVILCWGENPRMAAKRKHIQRDQAHLVMAQSQNIPDIIIISCCIFAPEH